MSAVYRSRIYGDTRRNGAPLVVENISDRAVQPDSGYKPLAKALSRVEKRLCGAIEAFEKAIEPFRLSVRRPLCFLEVDLRLSPHAVINETTQFFDVDIVLEVTYRGYTVFFDRGLNRLLNSDPFSVSIYHAILKHVTDWKAGKCAWVTESDIDAIISSNADKLNTGIELIPVQTAVLSDS